MLKSSLPVTRETKVSTVIPAYNEENTIGEIVTVLKKIDQIDEVVVVSDGSADNTALVARQAGARVIELAENIGKGGAMVTGVKEAQGDVILFLDADLIGLTPNHIEDLLRPVLSGEADTSVGIFEQGRLVTDLAQFIAPYLSGQRAIKREIFEQLSNAEVSRFGIEIALTRFLKENGVTMAEVDLPDLTHIMKEEKLGLVKGFAARLKMYWEIAKNVKGGWQ